MLVYVRPSNEALLRARVPGAQDQRGCPSIPFIVRVPRAQKIISLHPLPLLADFINSLLADVFLR